MENDNELFKRFEQRRIEYKEEELNKNSALIQSFINFCNSKKIKLAQENIDYIQTIGIVVEFPNIAYLLDNNLSLDKEGLVDLNLLERDYKKRPFFSSGYFSSDRYMIMAHPYFRREYCKGCNFAPRFIEMFWEYSKEDIHKYIAIDSDRVKINVDKTMYMERDTWYGAKFKNTIQDINDGVVKLRPPLGLEPFDIKFFFGNTYSLDIKWASKNGIKTFQVEEFKEESSVITKDEITYFPVKYLHAEFDLDKGTFRHFDGAIHFYTKEEYYQRRESDFNYNTKNSSQLKTLSQKLFKVNGQVTVEEWTNLVSHYLTGNPLIFEYFEGKLPDHTLEIVEKIIANNQQNAI